MRFINGLKGVHLWMFLLHYKGSEARLFSYTSLKARILTENTKAFFCPLRTFVQWKPFLLSFVHSFNHTLCGSFSIRSFILSKPYFPSNISITRDNVSSDFLKPRIKLKIRHIGNYFWPQNSRCLEMQLSPVSSVSCLFSIETKRSK